MYTSVRCEPVPEDAATPRLSCRSLGLPTLCVMIRFRAPAVLGAFALLCLPKGSGAQQGAVTVTATVQPLPLSLVDVRSTALPGELRVRVVGCGEGALTVDAITTAGPIRTDRVTVPASGNCSARDVSIQLAGTTSDVADYLVSLDHSNRLLAPSFSQFVVSASVVRQKPRSSVAY
jgi:hypothetical protein